MGARNAEGRRLVMVVEDEPAMREVLRIRLGQWGFEVCSAASVEEAGALLERARPAVVVCDVALPDGSGLDLLPELRGAPPHRPVIMITAHGTIDTAVEALKRGAVDFLTKPLDHQKLKAVLEEALSEADQRGAVQQIEASLAGASGMGGLVGTSAPMREVYRTIEVLAGSDAAALITGESGTGKELVARAIHDLSARASRPYIAVNAAAIPEGLMESELFGHEKGAFTGAVSAHAGCFELADRGTLFLDEIAEMPVALQPKFLRTLENGKVRRLGGSHEVTFDVRILAATNRAPEEAVRDGLLRTDLYYRLNVFTVVLPALRERAEDIPLLAQHFVGLFNKKHGASVEGVRREALNLLSTYPWPGNVRELRNVLERAVILAKGGWIETVHLPPYLRSGADHVGQRLGAGLTMAAAERLLILDTLKSCSGNKAEAARRLGVDVKTIRNKLKSYGLDTPE
jgi:DNA-binding NtrC family response regulator